MTWSHTPRLAIICWTVFAFPFTIWDTAYIFLRPHTLPGHKWHAPIFTPYSDYAAVDRVYGELAWLERDGFTAAQGIVNMTEATLYIVYFWIVMTRGDKSAATGGKRVVSGRAGGLAVTLGLVAGSVTATKTALYFMTECFSGFKHVGHADWIPLLSTWGFMNLLYGSISSYMVLSFGLDVVNGLSYVGESAATAGKRGGKFE